MKPVRASWATRLVTVLMLSLGTVLVALWAQDNLRALSQWNTLLSDASGYLHLWRLMLYGATAALWFRLQGRCSDPLTRAAWWRIGSLSLALILFIECSRLNR